MNKEPDIRVYAVLDSSMHGYTDYQLWNVEDLEGEYTCTGAHGADPMIWIPVYELSP
ncbi:MAG: hypothetical protein ACLTW9_26685 [Enterocloster sp.]